MREVWVALLAWTWLASGSAEPLTLEEALATVAAPHPDRQIAESDLALARADRDQMASIQDFRLFLDGTLAGGEGEFGGWRANNLGRVVARKPLFDFGRSSQAVAAADQNVAASQTALFHVQSLRRIDIMARFFDVLLADMQYAADNEFMAVAYVSWENAQDRFRVGKISQPELVKLEAEYQNSRERREASLKQVRSSRQKLAHAMYRPGNLPTELAEPDLPSNAWPVAEYESLLPWVMEKNPRVQVLQSKLAAADARIAAMRAEANPMLDAEVVGADFSRISNTRDNISAGVVFLIPLYQGGRVDALVAREMAQKERSAAELEKLKLELADSLLLTLQEIEWLRSSGRVAADKQIEYRDWALERSRAEYELELKTNLGTSMADTQVAALRRKQVEYQLALALARLEAMSGGSLPPLGGAAK
ncbi:TolC family protein [Thiobacillus sp.]|uniref:TolC family protein n=1 Tax=Thiobacillus sp. TaxID=924 RepID=UPI00286DA927|nr:TolC family protein [Thiobacillus sp.]